MFLAHTLRDRSGLYYYANNYDLAGRAGRMLACQISAWVFFGGHILAIDISWRLLA